MPENTDKKNSKYEHFPHSDCCSNLTQISEKLSHSLSYAIAISMNLEACIVMQNRIISEISLLCWSSKLKDKGPCCLHHCAC